MEETAQLLVAAVQEEGVQLVTPEMEQLELQLEVESKILLNLLTALAAQLRAVRAVTTGMSVTDVF